MPIPQEKITLVGWASCPSYLFLQEVYSLDTQNSCPVATPAVNVIESGKASPHGFIDRKKPIFGSKFFMHSVNLFR